MGSFTRRALFLGMTLVLVLAVFTGCSGSSATPTQPAAAPAPTKAASAAAPTTAPATAPTQAPAAAAQPAGQVIELRFHHQEPPTSCVATTLFAKYAKAIEDKTNGKVKVTVYPAETLGKAAQAIDLAENGIADIASGNMGLFTGRFPLTEGAALPLLGMKTAKQGSKMVEEYLETTPEVQKEWSKVKVLFLHVQTPHSLGLKDKKVQTMEDLKGLRIRSIAGPPQKLLQSLGITPVNMPMPDVFEAVQKGTIDGYSADWNATQGLRLNEVSKYMLEYPLYPQVFFMLMNQKKWDSLPPDVQKGIMEVSGMVGAETLGASWDACNDGARTASTAKGQQALQISDQEKARWAEKAPPIWEEWAKTADSKGANGKALIEKIKGLLEKHK